MDRFLYSLFELEERFPAPLRPPYRGAVFLFGLLLGWQGKLFLGAVLATVMLFAGVVPGLWLVLRFLAIAMVAGATGGAVSGLLEPLGRHGRPGEWVRWMLAIFSCLVTASLLLPAVPLALPDPAFFWAAGSISILGAVGLVLTDDRGPSRLAPHQFRVVRAIPALRAAPARLWEATLLRLERYQDRHATLRAELRSRPGARAELIDLLRAMRADIGHVRDSLWRCVRLMGGDPACIADADSWLRRIDGWMREASIGR